MPGVIAWVLAYIAPMRLYASSLDIRGRYDKNST